MKAKIIAPEGMSSHTEEVPLTYILGRLLLNVNNARLTDEQKYIEGVDAIRVFLGGKIKPKSKAGLKLKKLDKNYEVRLKKLEEYLKEIYDDNWKKYLQSGKLSIEFEVAREIHSVLMDVIYQQGLVSERGITDEI